MCVHCVCVYCVDVYCGHMCVSSVYMCVQFQISYTNNDDLTLWDGLLINCFHLFSVSSFFSFCCCWSLCLGRVPLSSLQCTRLCQCIENKQTKTNKQQSAMSLKCPLVLQVTTQQRHGANALDCHMPLWASAMMSHPTPVANQAVTRHSCYGWEHIRGTHLLHFLN